MGCFVHIENVTFDELTIGATAELRRLCTLDDALAFAQVSGNHNPMHLTDPTEAEALPLPPVVPGMFLGSLISAVLGTMLPGAGTLYHRQDLQFLRRAFAGDEVVARVEVTSTDAARQSAVLACTVTRPADGALLVTGEAEVEAPRHKIRQDSADLPGLIVQRHRHFERLLAQARPLPALATAVICPHDSRSLGGALLAMRNTLIAPVFLGDAQKIHAAGQELGEDLAGLEIIDLPDDTRAVQRAVAMVHEGRVQALMKGHLHTDAMLRPVLDRGAGLRTGRRLTHVFVMDVPGLDHPLILSDAAINIAPDLKVKVDIVQNAIEVARSIGIETPKVGILSAVETVTPDIPSSLDAALLSKMAERGQITGGLVDGPLAMDNAVDLGAARTKHITSPVAGRAEVLIVPNLDAGNMLAKQLAYISHAEGAGLVLGARVPIILNSRSDDDMARLASCAVAALHHARVTGGAA